MIKFESNILFFFINFKPKRIKIQFYECILPISISIKISKFLNLYFTHQIYYFFRRLHEWTYFLHFITTILSKTFHCWLFILINYKGIKFSINQCKSNQLFRGILKKSVRKTAFHRLNFTLFICGDFEKLF